MPRLALSISESLRVRLRQSLEDLLERVSLATGPVRGFEQVRQALEAMPLASAEFSLAVNRLANAQRYLKSGEPGAALFELRLLRGITSSILDP